ASTVSGRTAGSTNLVMPRDAALLAQSVNALLEAAETGGRDGEGVGTSGSDRQPAGGEEFGEEPQASRGRSRRPAVGAHGGPCPRRPRRRLPGVTLSADPRPGKDVPAAVADTAGDGPRVRSDREDERQ